MTNHFIFKSLTDYEKNPSFCPCGYFFIAPQSARSAWTWDSSNLSPTAPNQYVLDYGTSGNFSLRPVSTSYTEMNPGTGITVGSTLPVSFRWTSDQPIEIRLVNSGMQLDASFEIILDPDGDGNEATTISFDTIYSQVIADRGVSGGALGVAVNYMASAPTIGTALRIESAIFDGFGQQINVTSDMFAWRTNNGSPAAPDNFNVDGNGSYSWDSHASGFATIANGGISATTLPYGTTDLTKTISRQNLTIINENSPTDTNGASFRFSFGGGLTGVTPVPEPTSILLLSLAGIATFVWRRRNA